MIQEFPNHPHIFHYFTTKQRRDKARLVLPLPENIARVKQVHSDTILEATNSGIIGEADAIITFQKNLIVQIGVADCVPVFLVAENGSKDGPKQAVAAIHSGRKGTHLNIVPKAIKKLLSHDFQPKHIYARIGPSICGKCYEFGPEAYEYFDPKYITHSRDGSKNRLYLDVKSCVLDQLNSLLPAQNIEISPLCTYEESDLLYSYRRGDLIERMHGGLMIK